MEKIWKIIDIINWSKDYFDSKGIESARLNIELILSAVLNINRIKLYINYDLPLKPDELSKIREMVLRRAKREPLQYILGNTSFMGINLTVNSSVLIPRPETEELVDLVIKNHSNEPNIKIIDIGTGSGCIAIACALFLPQSTVVGLDISDEALKTAQINAKMNVVTNLSFEQKDFLTNCNFLNDYDVLISNPPYISKKEFEDTREKELFYEPRFALTDENDGLTFYKKFAEIAKSSLKNNTKIYLEISYNQAADVFKLFDSVGDIKIHKDFSGIERIIEVCVKK